MPLIGGNFVELRDCVFIKGFPSDSDVSVSEVRKYFEERVGECCVQMTALSKDKRWSFVTLKFDSATVAENAIERFDGKHICGHRVQMSFWRVPKSVAHSGRFDRNSTFNTNSRRWDDKSSFEDTTEKSTRHKDDYPMEKNNWNASHMPRDTSRRNDKEELSEDPDNFEGYQEHNFPERYNSSESFSYQNEEYLQDHWSSDGGEERAYPILDGNCTGWDSDFSGSNDNLSEREYYQREEEFPYPDNKVVWQESGVDRDREQNFADQDDAKDYQGHLADYESYPELYEGSLREDECANSCFTYSERPFEEIEDESPYRGEDLSTRNNREWYSDREYSNIQDSQDSDQEDNQSSFSSFDQTRQWPRWEKVSLSKPTRQRLSDPEVTKDTLKHASWAENTRSCNKLRDLANRNLPAFSAERPRSDELLRNTNKHFRDSSRHSTSPVNLRSKVYGHRGSPLAEDTSKASTEISYNSAHSRRGRCSISPARDRHSNRASSEEKCADFKLCGTLPGSERSSYSFNEQGLKRRKRESRSYSPNTKLRLLRGRGNKTGNGGRRGNDLRRSLMLHQQRQHSLLRERDREEGERRSERATKTSPDKPGKSHGSYNSTESSSTTQGTNRKRHKCDDEKRRDNTETTKRRRQTSLNNSDNKTGNSDSTRNKGIKVKSVSRKQPPRHQKGKTRQQRLHATDNSSTKRTDRLLKDLAVTLAEGNISLRRPGKKGNATKEDVNSVARKSVGSVRGRKSKPTGQSKSRRTQEKAVALVKENLQTTLDTVEDVKCGKVTDASWSRIEGASEGEITTPDNTTSQLTVPCSDDSSDQGKNNVAEFGDSTNRSTENLDNAVHYTYVNAEKSTRPDKVSSDNHDFLEIKKNCSFIVDIFENADVLEVNKHDLRSCSAVSDRKSKMDLIEKMVEEANSVPENYRDDQTESSDEPDHNSDYFALYQNHMQEHKVCPEDAAPNETMSANLQHVHMEISPTEENPPQLDVGEETWPPGDFTVSEDDRKEPGISVSYIPSENRCREGQRDISSNNEFSLRNSRPEKMLKTSSVNPLEGKGNKNVYQKEIQTNIQPSSHSCQDMEFSSNDTLPGVLHSNKVHYNPVKLYNAGNALGDRGEEEYIMSSIKEKASLDVTNTEHKTSEVGNAGSSVNNTETSVCSNEVNVDASKQGRYHNMGERTSTMEEEGCIASYSGREPFDSKNADINGSSDGKTYVTSSVLDVHELDAAVNYVKCKEKVMCTKEDVYVLEGAEVTQRDVYDEKDVVHVYNSSSEWCKAEDAVSDTTSTEQAVCSASVNDTRQKIYNQVGVSEDSNSNKDDDNMKDAVVDIELEHCDMESREMECIDDTHREEGTDGDISIFKVEGNDLDNSRFDAFNTEQGVRESNATHERDSSMNSDLNLTSKGQTCDVQEHNVDNREESCVTQQEVFCSKNGNPSNNARKESRGTRNGSVNVKDTEQQSFHLDTESSNIVHAQVTHEILNTEDPRCNKINSIQEKGVHGTTAEGNPIHIRTRYSCWTSLEPRHSSAVLAQYSPISDVSAVNSSVSSLNNSFVDSCVPESHNLVAEDLEPVDMEISSEDERHDNHIGSSICVNTKTSAKDDDACRPYSPSSPTWRSDEHRSPPPKLDISLYSPSHPTNVSSEGDVEQSITVEDISYEHDERECDAPICDTMEVVCLGGEPKNSSRSNEAEEETKTTYADSMGSASTSSFSFSSSPKSGPELFQGVSLTDDLSETKLPTKDPTQNRNEITNNETGENREKDSTLCTENPAKAKISKDDLKPMMRCQTRTQSLPAIPAPSTMDAKPKIIYVTAAKTYDFYTDNSAQHKPRIFYATNDKAAGPARSLSLDTTLGKSWTLDENPPLGSNNTPVYCEQQQPFERIPTVEVEKRKEVKDLNGRIEPLYHDGSFISEAPLEPSKDTIEDGDQEVIKISATSNSARSDVIAMLPAVEGPDNCADCGVTGSITSDDKESAISSTNSNYNVLPLGSTPENEMSLVSQTPLELGQKDVSTEHFRSTGRTPNQMTEGGSNWDTSNLMSCGSDETLVTSEVTDEKLLAFDSEGCGFGRDDDGTPLLKSPEQGSSVSEEGGNEKDVQSEFICCEIQQQVLPLETVQTLSNSPSRSANKRAHHDSTTEASRPCKVPRKPLKLIIPAGQPSNRGVKRTSNRGYLGKHSKKTSTCTITRADMVPETNVSCMPGDGSAITELYTCDKDAMSAEKDSSSENGELMYTLSPAISRMDGSESNSLSMTGSLLPTSTTGNTSPLTAHFSPYNQTPTSAENDNIKEHTAQSCSGKESDWVTVKMERLQKKKEEIEQVYKKECHTVVNVVKMLVSNDPRLEGLLQNAVRRSLQEMGRRCVQELVKQARPGT